MARLSYFIQASEEKDRKRSNPDYFDKSCRTQCRCKGWLNSRTFCKQVRRKTGKEAILITLTIAAECSVGVKGG